jgi:hypothetical protein
MVWCESDRQAGHVKMTVQVKTGMFRFKFLKQISDRYLSVRYKWKKTFSHRVSYECPVTEGVVKWEQTRVWIVWSVHNSTGQTHGSNFSPVQPISKKNAMGSTSEKLDPWVFRFFSYGPWRTGVWQKFFWRTVKSWNCKKKSLIWPKGSNGINLWVLLDLSGIILSSFYHYLHDTLSVPYLVPKTSMCRVFSMMGHLHFSLRKKKWIGGERFVSGGNFFTFQSQWVWSTPYVSEVRKSQGTYTNIS